MTDVETNNPKPKTTATRRIAMWLVALNYTQAGISFFVNFWLARTLGSDEYGLLQYGMVVGGICTVLVGFSSERTLVRDLVHSKDSRAMLAASLVLRSLMAVLILGSCLSWVLLSDSLGAKKVPVILCSVWGALSALSSRGWLDKQYKMHVHAAITLAERAAYAISIFLLIRFAFEGNYAIIAATCLVGFRAVALVCEWYYASRTFAPVFNALRTNLLFLVRQNWLVLLAAIANLLMTHANQLLLEHELGSASLACYSVAFQVILLIQLFQSQMLRLLAPRTAELTNIDSLSTDLRYYLLRYMGYMLAASALLITPIVLLAPWVIRMTLSEEYQAAVPVLRILSCWALIYGPALVLNQFLLGLRLQKIFFAVTIIAGGLALVLGRLFVPQYGANAVAWVLLISHAFSIAMQFLIVLRKANSVSAVSADNDLQG